MKRRGCYFTNKKIERVDYKDVPVLKYFLSESGKIVPRRFSGVRARYQRQLSTAVRHARFLALVAYCDNHRSDF